MNASNQQAARLELQKRGIPFSPDCFVKCVEKHNEDVVRLFIEAGIDVNAPNSEGFTALMKAAYTGSLPRVSLLSCKGADVNKKGRDGWTPLMMAAQQHATDIVRFLVGKDPLSISIFGRPADVTVKNDDGETALMIAEKKFGAPQELIDCLKSISKP